MKLTPIIKTILLISYCLNSFSQSKVKNLTNFDDHPYHFGFVLGVTNSSFYIDRVANFNKTDSLLAIDLKPQAAFIVGPIFSLNLNKNIHLRSGVSFSFQDRIINYTYQLTDTTKTFDKKVHSFYTEIPLHLKLRTNRLNNYAIYALGGIKYGYDWTSQIGVKETYDFNDVLKINRKNLAYCVGGGFDFFLNYFKLGIDFRLDIGINNLIIKNKTLFSSPIDKLRSRMFQVVLTFEGSI